MDSVSVALTLAVSVVGLMFTLQRNKETGNRLSQRLMEDGEELYEIVKKQRKIMQKAEVVSEITQETPVICTNSPSVRTHNQSTTTENPLKRPRDDFLEIDPIEILQKAPKPQKKTKNAKLYDRTQFQIAKNRLMTRLTDRKYEGNGEKMQPTARFLQSFTRNVTKREGNRGI